MKQVSENYRKVRNTFRFLLANLSNFTADDLVVIDGLEKADQYMLVKLNEVMEACRKAYDHYDFSDVTAAITNFMTNELSAYYLDYTKDILYIEAKNDPRRTQVQTVLYHCVDALSRLFAPILPHTCEEVHDFFKPNEESIHLQEFLPLFEVKDAEAIKKDMASLFEIRSDVFKALEQARADKVIGKSLEAKVVIALNEADRTLVDAYFGSKFAQWLIVSKVEVALGSEREVSVEKFNGTVCPRCWNVHEGSNEHGLCDRCADVMAREYPDFKYEG